MSTIDIMAFLHATEQAALRAGHATGLGDPDEARHLAIEGMHGTLAPLPIDGRIVIGEGHIADGEKLFKSEEIGTGGPAVDIAAAAIDGASLVVKGQNGAVSAIAITGEGGVLHLPDIYMEKICVGPQAKGRIDLNLPVKENLRRIAEGLQRGIDDLSIVILDRPRHEDLIHECRSAGARIRLISDGDITPAVDAAIEGSGIHALMGIGGAQQGVIAAAALKCLGGDMQCRLIPYTNHERKEAEALGIFDFTQVLTIDDLVRSDDCVFSATAVTDTSLMHGVRYFGVGVRTSSLVMDYKKSTIQFIDTVHRFDPKARWRVRY